MSTKNALLAAGLIGAGLAAVMARAVAQGPAPSVPAAPSPAPSPPTVLLKSNGDVVRGTVTEMDDGYLVKTPLGTLPFRRSEVEHAFGSLREVYLYKASRVPDRDPEERMKLVQWCLAQRLVTEAQEQLELVLKQDPDHPRARAMRFQIQAVAERTKAAPDQAVLRTSVEKVEPPAPIGSKTLHDLRDAARKNPIGAGRPVIFDLPEALAIKRYQAFAAYVHPALQRACASCHNEQSNTTFQLIQARAKRDLDNDLLVRANLDAALRLIDPADPPRSELLSSSIMPHKPTGRPILTGPNDPTYRLLLGWVNSLRSSQSPAASGRDGAATAATGTDPTSIGEGGFAADRAAAATAVPRPFNLPAPRNQAAAPAPPAGNGPSAPHTVTMPNGEVVAVQPKPPGQVLPGSATGLPKTVPPPDDFRTSPLLDGPNPATLTTGAPANPTQVPARPGQAKTINVPGLGEIPVVDTRELDPKKGDKSPGATDSSSARSKLNPDALQQFMSGRSGR
jgi:hypothetical protein